MFSKAQLKIPLEKLKVEIQFYVASEIWWKNIETLLSSTSIILNKIKYFNITNWDMGDFVHFL